VLEALESQFYAQALSKFQPSDFTDAGFTSSAIPIQEFTSIGSDEATHLQTLQVSISFRTHILSIANRFVASQAVLIAFGLQPLNCSFDFSSALTSVSAMTPIARTVEYVGVGAYLGAAPLIQDPAVLAAAGSIVTDESRHQTILNLMQGATPAPQAFDIPLLPQEVLAIAGAFISGPCDTGITRTCITVTNWVKFLMQPLHPFVFPYGITSQRPTLRHQHWKYHDWHAVAIQFVSPQCQYRHHCEYRPTHFTFISISCLCAVRPQNFNCQMLIGGMPVSLSQPINNCIVPEGINGPVVIWITSDSQPLANNLQVRPTQAVVSGPTVAFIDSVGDMLAQLVRPNTGNGAGAPPPPPTTLTLSPAQASSLLPSPSSPPSSSPTADPNNASNSNGKSSGVGVIVNGISLVPAPTPSST
jgi:hypothetical protein